MEPNTYIYSEWDIKLEDVPAHILKAAILIYEYDCKQEKLKSGKSCEKLDFFLDRQV